MSDEGRSGDRSTGADRLESNPKSILRSLAALWGPPHSPVQTLASAPRVRGKQPPIHTHRTNSTRNQGVPPSSLTPGRPAPDWTVDRSARVGSGAELHGPFRRTLSYRWTDAGANSNGSARRASSGNGVRRLPFARTLKAVGFVQSLASDAASRDDRAGERDAGRESKLADSGESRLPGKVGSARAGPTPPLLTRLRRAERQRLEAHRSARWNRTRHPQVR